MSLTPDDVQRLARLARIRVEPDEAAPVLERLNGVLGLVDAMRAVDTSGVVPMAHALEVTQRLRGDEVRESDQRSRFQAVAPAVERGLYLVPRVIE